MASRDYIVEYRSKEIIAEIADKIRNLRRNNKNQLSINITDFIINDLRKFFIASLELNLYLPDEDERVAYVSYNPLTLNVTRGIWRAAQRGDLNASYILAHEIGHLVLHQDFEKAFSLEGEEQIRALGNERSAEWQANMFADYFLCPDVYVIRFLDDTETLATLLNISSDLAEHRVRDVKRFGPAVSIAMEGDPCPLCNTLTLVPVGTEVRCTSCRTVYTR